MSIVLVAALAAAGLAGCAGPRGYAGLTVDEQGNPVVVLAWCGRPPQQVVVQAWYNAGPDSPPPSSADTISALVIRAPRLYGNVAEVNLVKPDGGWVITNDSLRLDDRAADYYAYGETDSPDDQVEVDFRLDDLATLSPGQVFGIDDSGNPQIISLTEFNRYVTQRC